MTVCFTGGWRYQDFEKDFLTFIKEADLANIIGHIQPGNELTKLKDEIRATEGRLLEARTHRDKAFSLVLEQAPSEFLNQKVREYDLLVTNLETTFSNQNQMLHVVTQQTASFEEGKEGLTELIDKLQSVNSDEVFSLRSAVAFHLKSITDYIGVWSASRSFSVRFKDGTFRFARPNVDMAALSNTFDGV